MTQSGARESETWANTKVELFLNIALEYKVKKNVTKCHKMPLVLSAVGD